MRKISDEAGSAAVMALVVAGTIVAGLLAVTGFSTIVARQSPAAASSLAGDLSPQAVPDPTLLAWVMEAGSLCPQFPSAVIAAQISVESGWNPADVSPTGALGIAQFMPDVWPSWSADDDHTGNVVPTNSADAIMAQGRYDCALARAEAPLAASTGVPVLSLALAAYNAGPDAVKAAGGIPALPETQGYVLQVEALAPTLLVHPPGTFGSAIVTAAETQLGVPYVWGGGDIAGPTGGPPPGWDCSGLVLWAVYQATSGKVQLPHSSELQATMGQPVGRAAMQPGDVIAFQEHQLGDFDHIAIYIGGGQVIEAPDTGDVVKVQPLTAVLALPFTVRRFT